MTAPPRPLPRLAVALTVAVLHGDAAGAAAQDLARGTIVDSVACADAFPLKSAGRCRLIGQTIRPMRITMTRISVPRR
jgi:hypothetical protein